MKYLFIAIIFFSSFGLLADEKAMEQFITENLGINLKIVKPEDISIFKNQTVYHEKDMKWVWVHEKKDHTQWNRGYGFKNGKLVSLSIQFLGEDICEANVKAFLKLQNKNLFTNRQTYHEVFQKTINTLKPKHIPYGCFIIM